MISSTGGLTAASLGFGALSAAPASTMTPSANKVADSAAPARGSLQSAQQALAALKQIASRSAAKDAAKEAARQKLAVLKAQLNNLMMFGGDPKTRAKEAARIAKAIGEAAQDYAQAGGGSADTAAATSASVQPQEVADADSGVDQASSAETADAAAQQDDPQPLGDAGPRSETSQTSDSKSPDREFITDARLLARRAKAILQSALQEAHRTKSGLGQTSQEGDQALTAIDRAALALGLGRGSGADIGVAYGASAQSIAFAPAPTVRATA